MNINVSSINVFDKNVFAKNIYNETFMEYNVNIVRIGGIALNNKNNEDKIQQLENELLEIKKQLDQSILIFDDIKKNKKESKININYLEEQKEEESYITEEIEIKTQGFINKINSLHNEFKFNEINKFMNDIEFEDFSKQRFNKLLRAEVLPSEKKIETNQALYNKNHIIWYLLLDNLKNLDINDIKVFTDFIKTKEKTYSIEQLFEIVMTIKFNVANYFEDEINKMINSIKNDCDEEYDNEYINLIKVLIFGVINREFDKIIKKSVLCLRIENK